MTAFSIRELNVEEYFDPFTLADNVHFTQSHVYGHWQRAFGRTVRRFVVSDESTPRAYFQSIRYPLAFSKTFCGIPYGPVLRNASPELVAYLHKELLRITREEHSVFTRVDFVPTVGKSDLAHIPFSKPLSSTYRGAYFQPRTEWVLAIDTSRTHDVFFASLDKKTRSSITAAQKHGVTSRIVSKNFMEHFDVFYALMQETAQHNEFHLHSREYYQTIFSHPETATCAYLVITEYEKRPVAMAFVVVYGTAAHYVFGASNTVARETNASYIMQWDSIHEAIARGCVQYNFGGVINQGLSTFKKKFGGEAVQHSDFYDVVAEPWWYRLYVARKVLKNVFHSNVA